ncbi:MAG: hypothetical protein DMG16_04030 [Acidobacteria bacterium]|nr:MAG: hypothetical protein DMG16_04030 [Acidobacteriota bacterium]
MNALSDQYCLDERYGSFKVANPRTTRAGYFRIGEKAVAYGETAAGFLQPDAECDLYDVLRDVRVTEWDTVLPFDPDEVIDNLRCERYMGSAAQGVRGLLLKFAKKSYYTIRPFMPVRFRKHLQRIYLRDWNGISFPSWPVDRTVENIFEELLALSLRSHRVQKIPFVWFWPDGYSACVIVTHDIETEAGRSFATELADLDASFGIKSAFQIVPEERYEVSPAFLDSLRLRGCELNLHGLNHDGQLFRDRKEFLRQIKRINQYAREYGAAGFRSPVMYRNIEWYGDLEFSYDMSVPNVGHLEPQRGGCCTVMPYFIGNLVELPLTTTQDYALFNVLRDQSIALWKQQIGLVTEKHGLVSFNVHPDYLISNDCREVYRQLLEHLLDVRADQGAWFALPGEVDQWWRNRRQMRIVTAGGRLRVAGPSSERAVVAYARLENGRVIYELPGREREVTLSSA